MAQEKKIPVVYFKRSNDLNQAQTGPKQPNAADLSEGELVMNYKKGYETLFMKNDENEIVSFPANNFYEQKFNELITALSGLTIQNENLNNKVNELSEALSAETVRAASAETALQEEIATFAHKPVTIWETDGTTGLLGVNDNTMNLNSWQLENLDFSPYKFVLAYFKQADRDFSTLETNYVTPSVVVMIPLDAASLSTGYTAYIGGTNTTNPNDRNVEFCVIAAIDETKTKFKVVSEHSLYGTALGGRNDNGRYCYKLVGYYE